MVIILNTLLLLLTLHWQKLFLINFCNYLHHCWSIKPKPTSADIYIKSLPAVQWARSLPFLVVFKRKWSNWNMQVDKNHICSGEEELRAAVGEWWVWHDSVDCVSVHYAELSWAIAQVILPPLRVLASIFQQTNIICLVWSMFLFKHF